MSPSALNRELTGMLIDGRRLGFEIVWEYPSEGAGRWVRGRVELAARKHAKGDLLNRHDAGLGLGVIVLAGTRPEGLGQGSVSR
jgi:hypothetical protein